MTLVEPSWDDARQAAHEAALVLPTEAVDLAGAVGRTLAAPVRALTPLPAFDTSAMDGYAVRGRGPWRLVGEVLAGNPPHAHLVDGECVRIATGAAVPSGATAVLRWEDATVTDAIVHGEVAAGRDIRPTGEEVEAGSELIAAGTVLGPAQVGLAAAAGADALEVRVVPRATLLVFGDELLTSGPAGDGRVRDSLGPQVPGWSSRLGMATSDVVRVPDTLQAHVEAIDAATTPVVLTTGGTAAGPVDHLHAALARLGAELLVDTVAVRPGHPMVLARRGEQWVVGLPGNPQSAVVALLSLGAPLVAGLLGQPVPPLRYCVLGEDVVAPPTETRLVLATRDDQGTAHPVSRLGSGMLRGLAAAHGFAVIDPGGQPAGATARWLPLP